MGREDAPALFTYWSDRDVVRYMNVPPFGSEEEAWEMINLLNGLSETEDAMRWGIELKDGGLLIGSCGFNNWELDGAYRAEIGYEIGQEHWGQGYMSEALTALLEYGYNTMGLNRIEGLVDPRNEGSIRLLERVGFKNEGLLREYQQSQGEFVDLYMFSLLKREYQRGEGHEG
ncbi:N-acetyltransferase [Paenibacillus sp. CAA11]|nr:N-acetyltransferase [Paenibacillus sp. CAA11]